MANPLSAANANEQPPPPPPQEINEPPPPPSFNTLPLDLIQETIARVPRRYHQTLSCVSKSLRDLVRSPEIHKIRSLLGRESLYICYNKQPSTRSWYALKTSPTTTVNHFSAVKIEFPYNEDVSAIAIGPEIYFICEPVLLPVASGPPIYTTTIWIFDSRSGRIHRGPGLTNIARIYPSRNIGFIGGKIYSIGIFGQARSLDLKTETWEQAPVPYWNDSSVWITNASVTLDRKLCSLSVERFYSVCYDPIDGSCSILHMPDDTYARRTGACVMNNVLYIYFNSSGLMWYDSRRIQWRVVNGLSHLKIRFVAALGEYYGKLAVLWEDYSRAYVDEMKEVWCRMIRLERRGGEIYGVAEEAERLGTVPRRSLMIYCFSVSD